MPDFDINLWPLTRMLIAMLLTMAVSAIIVAFITVRLPKALSRPLIYIAPFAGAFIFFEYLSPFFN